MNKPGSLKRAGKSFIGVLAGVAVLSVGGFAAYKVFFQRTGEAAIRFIPADADVVVTMDTNPSERQALTFKQISDALESQGLTDRLDKMLKDGMDGSPVAAEIRPHLATSFAMAYWNVKPGQPQKMAALLALKDAAAVQTALAKLPRDKNVYTLPNNSGKAAVIEDYLVIAPDAALIGSIQNIHEKGSTSIADNAAFNEARAALPSDANLMVFVSPTVLQDLGKTAAEMGTKMNPFTGTNWLSFSVTVEPEGVAFDYYGPTNADAVPGMKNLASVAPVSAESLKMLPEGALGVLAYSQAGKYWNYAKEVADKESETQKVLDKGVAEVEKEFGLSIDKDIAPAFNGETILAFYPKTSGKEFDGDVVAIFTDKNGATPAELVKKLRTLIEQRSKEGGQKGITFVESRVGDTTVIEFDAETQNEIMKGMQGSKPPVQLQSKVLQIAIKGQNVIVTTSKATLNSVISNSGKTLMEDPGFAVMSNELEKGTQGLLAINIKRTLESVRSLLEPSMKDSPVSMDDLIHMFGDGAMPMYIVGKYDGKTGTGRMMLPLDYEVFIKMIGTSMKSMDQPSPSLTEKDFSTETNPVLK